MMAMRGSGPIADYMFVVVALLLQGCVTGISMPSVSWHAQHFILASLACYLHRGYSCKVFSRFLGASRAERGLQCCFVLSQYAE